MTKFIKETLNLKYLRYEINYIILRIKISKISNGLILSMCHYLNKIFEKFNNSNSKIVITHVDVNLYLSMNIE